MRKTENKMRSEEEEEEWEEGEWDGVTTISSVTRDKRKYEERGLWLFPMRAMNIDDGQRRKIQ